MMTPDEILNSPNLREWIELHMPLPEGAVVRVDGEEYGYDGERWLVGDECNIATGWRPTQAVIRDNYPDAKVVSWKKPKGPSIKVRVVPSDRVIPAYIADIRYVIDTSDARSSWNSEIHMWNGTILRVAESPAEIASMAIAVAKELIDA